jgi:SpoVK/Ycf46/Vps4 family AAA+-type ATPase
VLLQQLAYISYYLVFYRYGPPGTGKTLLAKAVATESEANFMAVSIPELIKGEVGESEKAIAKVFKTASKCSPCIVFLDELEAIFGTRESSGGLGKQVRMPSCIQLCLMDVV